jgi:hypothetical protein
MEALARSAAARRLGRMALWAVIAAVVAFWVSLAIFAVPSVPNRPTDFADYFGGALALASGRPADMYSWPAIQQIMQTHLDCIVPAPSSYSYPPLLVILLQPLTGMSCGSALIIWHAVNLLVWIASAGLLAALLCRRWPEHRLLATALALFLSAASFHMLFGYFLGQVHLIVLCLLLLAWWLEERGRPLSAGAILVVCALIKLFPAVLVGYYVVRGRWRVALGAVLAGIPLTVLMVIAAGPRVVLESLPYMAEHVRFLSTSPINESLSAQLPAVGPALVWVVGAATGAGILLARGRGRTELGYVWIIPALLLISPLVWSFYEIWSLPALVACLGVLSPRRWWAVAGLIVLYLATALPLPLVVRPLATLALWAITGAFFLHSAGVWPHLLARRARLAAPVSQEIGVPRPSSAVL